jgi:predicted hotdog family 3-hydroxylacyl-ACP dehydratase
MSGYPPIEELLPHSGPMVLLDALTHWTKGSAQCRLRVRDCAPFVVAGHVESVVTLEYMAQAVAACLGYEALLGGGAVRVGMVIACKRFEAFAAQLCVGDELAIHVQCIQGNDTLSHFDCKVLRAGELFASSVLTLYHAAQLPDATG